MKLKSFDIVVEIDSAQGGKHRERRDNVQSPDENTLRMLHASSGERVVEILNVRDGDEIRDISGNPQPNGLSANQNTTDQSTEIRQNGAPLQGPVEMPFVAAPRSACPHKAQPKFYKIGDAEIKEVDGKIYQKQWVSLDVNETGNYRVVSNATNRIVPLKDKHIEIKKWVPVSSTTADDDCSGLELING